MPLELGFDVNASDRHGWTPLHFAAACGNRAVAEQLVQAGADPRAKTLRGQTPQDLARVNGRSFSVPE